MTLSIQRGRQSEENHRLTQAETGRRERTNDLFDEVQRETEWEMRILKQLAPTQAGKPKAISMGRQLEENHRLTQAETGRRERTNDLFDEVQRETERAMRILKQLAPKRVEN